MTKKVDTWEVEDGLQRIQRKYRNYRGLTEEMVSGDGEVVIKEVK